MCVEKELNRLQEEELKTNTRQVVSEKIQNDVGYRVFIYIRYSTSSNMGSYEVRASHIEKRNSVGVEKYIS